MKLIVLAALIVLAGAFSVLPVRPMLSKLTQVPEQRQWELERISHFKSMRLQVGQEVLLKDRTSVIIADVTPNWVHLTNETADIYMTQKGLACSAILIKALPCLQPSSTLPTTHQSPGE